MARSPLPTIPLVVFGVIEPALLIWAYIVGMCDPLSYYADQAPDHAVPGGVLPAQALGMTLQMLNVLLLLAALAVTCCFSHDPATAKRYLVAVAFADYGHIWGTYRAVGRDYFSSPSRWNHMVWGSVAASAVLNILRWLTVLGVFGPVEAPSTSSSRANEKRA